MRTCSTSLETCPRCSISTRVHFVPKYPLIVPANLDILVDRLCALKIEFEYLGTWVADLASWADRRVVHLAQQFPLPLRPPTPNPSAWTPGFGKITGPALLPALFKPPDSIALDNPSENSVASPPTPPDSLHSHLATLLVRAALIAAVCHGRRTTFSHQNYSRSFPLLSTRRKNNALSRRDCVIRQVTASPSTFCAIQHDTPRRVATPPQHSRWGN